MIVGTLSDHRGVKFNGETWTDGELGGQWPETMPSGSRIDPPKKVYPADFGYREEATAAYLAQGLPLPIIPPAEPPA